MTKSSLPAPRYSIWQAISAALALSTRAIEEVRALSRLPGPQGEPGKNGEPGSFDPEKLSVAIDSERGVFLRYDGKEIGRIGGVFRGVFRAGQSYLCGDTVTFDGSQWHCNSPSGDRPGTSKAWQLMVRKGADGKSAPPSPPRSTTPFGDK